MVDDEIVCCMCGDVGFTDKLFRCNKCRHRFQHSYCSSNYFYGDHQLAVDDHYCDWCQAAKNTVPSSNSKKPPAVTVTINRANSGCSSSSSSSHNHRSEKRKSPVPNSPRHATRRYKLLKDVMC